jgi:hypothetical protein
MSALRIDLEIKRHSKMFNNRRQENHAFRAFSWHREALACRLLVAGLHRVVTGASQRIGSLEFLLDEEVPFRQLQECRLVLLQVWTKEA